MNDMIAKQEGEKIKRENDSKIEWTRLNAKEVTTYDIDDIATGHRVIDDVWLVQHQHGSFSERAARDARPVA